MKRALFLVACLLVAMPAAAQTSLLPTIQRLRAEYPTPMSPRQIGELLNRIAWEHRGDGWGLLRKTGGHRCPAPQGVDTSCDILVHAPSVRHFDVLSDAEGAAIPVWRDVGPCVISPSSGCSMSNFLAPVRPAQAAIMRTAGDYDGDGKVDQTVYRPSTGAWYTRRSLDNLVSGVLWGVSSDTPVPCDYDGDGRMDQAVFRPSTGAWYLLMSRTGSSSTVVWGHAADVPVPADYDGDARCDTAVFRPSNGTWYIRFATGQSRTLVWGTNGDVPTVGDFDADGRADVGVFRPSTVTFHLLFSSGPTTAIVWGLPDDLPYVGDFDGDGRSDLALYRRSNGTWYIGYATGLYTAIPYGAADDVPVPGDYDGDGRADVGVYRPSTGMWYWISAAGAGSTQWGSPGDLAIVKK